jgi:hypothetical protein
VDTFNRRGIPRARAVIGNAIDLNTQSDSSKDIVVCLFILQHLSEDDGRKALDPSMLQNPGERRDPKRSKYPASDDVDPVVRKHENATITHRDIA